MDFIKRGQIVISLAGRDKGKKFAVVEVKDKYLLLADGKERPLNRPKLKKIIHIQKTQTVLQDETFRGDNALRKALANDKTTLEGGY